MNIGEVIQALRQGKAAFRPFWESDVYIYYRPQVAEVAEHLMIRRRDGLHMPWTPLGWDLLAEDWETN